MKQVCEISTKLMFAETLVAIFVVRKSSIRSEHSELQVADCSVARMDGARNRFCVVIFSGRLVY